MKLPRHGLWIRQFLYIYLVAVSAIVAMTLVITAAVRQFSVRQLEADLLREARLASAAIGRSELAPDAMQSLVRGQERRPPDGHRLQRAGIGRFPSRPGSDGEPSLSTGGHGRA